MLKPIMYVFFTVIGMTFGYAFVPSFFSHIFGSTEWPFSSSVFGAVIGACSLSVSTAWLAKYSIWFIQWVEQKIEKKSLVDIMISGTGLIIGLLVAHLFTPSLHDVPVVGLPLQFFISVLLGYLGFKIGYIKRDDLVSVWIEMRHRNNMDKSLPKHEAIKLLDTSVIIDGRVADLVSTGFLEGTLIVPTFVLDELQQIADSSDKLKRDRGRRGLDVLRSIQRKFKSKVKISETDFEGIQDVDSKLVHLAKHMQCTVVTNDLNLNTVCRLQDVKVLNINDLIDALKPSVLSDEKLTVNVVKKGKEFHQGIGYLDDGSMVVVEHGRQYIGSLLDVLVTRVLPTATGRIIFGKPKSLKKAL